jgi:hypothetical protein
LGATVPAACPAVTSVMRIPLRAASDTPLGNFCRVYG